MKGGSRSAPTTFDKLDFVFRQTVSFIHQGGDLSIGRDELALEQFFYGVIEVNAGRRLPRRKNTVSHIAQKYSRYQMT